MLLIDTFFLSDNPAIFCHDHFRVNCARLVFAAFIKIAVAVFFICF